MPDSLITSAFDRALYRSPQVRPFTAAGRGMANFGIGAFLVLATALGIAETELVPDSAKPAWRAWGAPIGMFQWFAVFAPDLRSINWHSTAVIEFADGSLKNYEFPRPGKMSLFEAYIKSPERVFFDEQMPNLHHRNLLPAVSRYIARANFDPHNQPKTVTLVIHTAALPGPSTEHWIWRDSLPHHTFSQTYFVYKVLPQDLAEASGH